MSTKVKTKTEWPWAYYEDVAAALAVERIDHNEAKARIEMLENSLAAEQENALSWQGEASSLNYALAAEKARGDGLEAALERIANRSTVAGMHEHDRADKLRGIARAALSVQPEEGYKCPVCGHTDPSAYVRCNHPACPDGRDPRPEETKT